MVTLASDNPVSDDVRAAVGEAIDAFLDEQAGVLSGLSPTTAPLLKRARMFTSGGKRLRPAFALWAWTAITGRKASFAVVPTSSTSSSELILGTATSILSLPWTVTEASPTPSESTRFWMI